MISHSNLRGIARPYAKAAFEYACGGNQLSRWSAVLHVLADVFSEPSIIAALKNPSTDGVECVKTIIETDKDFFSDDGIKNLIYLLAEKHRLLVFPELFQLFEAYYAEYQKIIHVDVVSADPISEDQKDKFVTALKIRLQRDVNINFNEDKRLIGGAVITVGDLVIDGSLKSVLARLSNNLVYG